MLKDFLELLGKTTGKTLTPAEFKQVVKEALAVEDIEAGVEEPKKDEKTSDKKNK